jgi:hypothetical protein
MTRDQVGTILRDRGYLGGGAAPGVQEPGTPVATTPLAPTPPDPSVEGSGILGPGDLKSTARGMAKGAAEFGVGATRLAGKGLGLISPGAQSKLGELAEQVPGVTRLEQFADRPYTDLAEAAGDLGGSMLSGGAIERGLTTGIVRGVEAITPLARYARGAGGMSVVPTTAGKITKYAAPAAGAVGAGVAGGIAGDPQDPVSGAEVGAATGFVPGAVGRGMRSRAGQYLGGSLTRSAAGAAMHGALPGAGLFGHGLRHTVVSYHSPVGQWLQKFGKGLFDKGGRLIGWINPVTGGFVASNALGGGPPSDDSAPDPYQQPSPPVASTEEAQ